MATLRDCLKIVNWYVRDRQMQKVLRQNILSLAQVQGSEKRWAKTYEHLK